jgi:hypothetical protein
MHANASAIRVAAVSLDDDIGRVIPDWKEIPHTGSAAMTRRRPPVAKDRIAGAMRSSADRKDSSHPSPLRREGRMTHRVDAAMHSVQSTPGDTSPHRFLAQARMAQLGKRDNAVLPSRELGHRDLRFGDFLVHR